jgi:hypothetical protein
LQKLIVVVTEIDINDEFIIVFLECDWEYNNLLLWAIDIIVTIGIIESVNNHLMSVGLQLFLLLGS